MALASFSILIKCLRFCGEQTLGCVISSGAGCCLHDTSHLFRPAADHWSCAIVQSSPQLGRATSRRQSSPVSDLGRRRRDTFSGLLLPDTCRSSAPISVYSRNLKIPEWRVRTFRRLQKTNLFDVVNQQIFQQKVNRESWPLVWRNISDILAVVFCCCGKFPKTYSFGGLIKVKLYFVILFLHLHYISLLGGWALFRLLQTPTFLVGEEDLVRSQPCFSTL